jgi:hypothetical protein
VDVPISITGVAAGRLELLGIAICSNSEDADHAAGSPIAVAFDVLPLLNLSASATSARSGDGGYIVSIEVSGLAVIVPSADASRQSTWPFGRSLLTRSIPGVLTGLFKTLREYAPRASRIAAN